MRIVALDKSQNFWLLWKKLSIYSETFYEKLKMDHANENSNICVGWIIIVTLYCAHRTIYVKQLLWQSEV